MQRLNKEKFNTYPNYNLTSLDKWDPYNLLSAVNQMKTELLSMLSNGGDDTQAIINLYSISSELMDFNYFHIFVKNVNFMLQIKLNLTKKKVTNVFMHSSQRRKICLHWKTLLNFGGLDLR